MTEPLAKEPGGVESTSLTGKPKCIGLGRCRCRSPTSGYGHFMDFERVLLNELDFR